MIFEETYKPAFDRLIAEGVDLPAGRVAVELVGVASRTGRRAEAYRASGTLGDFQIFSGPNAVAELIGRSGGAAVGSNRAVDLVFVAAPDDRHFEPCLAALSAGRHLSVEKPSVLSLDQLDRLVEAADRNRVAAKTVYHKLLDPDHKRLRTLTLEGVLRNCRNGYCSLLEPKSISTGQFSEWIAGRNPATYVAVHYLKLIDFTFFERVGELATIKATGQRGLVGAVDSTTWDSVQTQVEYRRPDGRSAAFDIHTSWVHPDNFSGYVEQEVQFRFDNGVWNGHSRKRGVELAVEGMTPELLKITPNHHYNAAVVEPWIAAPTTDPVGKRDSAIQTVRRGYGVEAVERIVREVAEIEFGGPPSERDDRWRRVSELTYDDLRADRRVVAAVQAIEAILADHAAGRPDSIVRVNGPQGGLTLERPGSAAIETLYSRRV
jgi:predicted dehydrogenase